MVGTDEKVMHDTIASRCRDGLTISHYGITLDKIKDRGVDTIESTHKYLQQVDNTTSSVAAKGLCAWIGTREGRSWLCKKFFFIRGEQEKR